MRDGGDRCNHHQLGGFECARLRAGVSAAPGDAVCFCNRHRPGPCARFLGSAKRFAGINDHLGRGMSSNRPGSPCWGALGGDWFCSADCQRLLVALDFPVLEQRRSLAQRAILLRDAELENRLDLIAEGRESIDDWIMAFTGDLAALRNQMAQFPISHYFHVGEPQTALAGVLP